MQYRTIVLEDDDNARELLTLLLRQRNHEVLSFSAPSVCPVYGNSECLCPQDYACGDFLITDNKMPGMTGLEFVQRQAARNCRGVNRNKAIISGTWTDAQMEVARGLGCQLFTKPLNLAAFLNWLDERERNVLPGRKLAQLS
jgi:CheY-like chemotaxis protein